MLGTSIQSVIVCVFKKHISKLHKAGTWTGDRFVSLCSEALQQEKG